MFVEEHTMQESAFGTSLVLQHFLMAICLDRMGLLAAKLHSGLSRRECFLVGLVLQYAWIPLLRYTAPSCLSGVFFWSKVAFLTNAGMHGLSPWLVLVLGFPGGFTQAALSRQLLKI